MRELTPIVCLCVYDRQKTCGRWLRAWDNAKKHSAKLVVIHNFDPVAGSPKVEQVNRILEWQPNFYVPRVNVGGDIGAFKDFLDRKDEFPYWNAVLWFADDCIPMQKYFMDAFLDKLSKPEVGLVGAFFEPDIESSKTYSPQPRSHVAHIRTCCFAIKREVAMRLRFPHDMKHPGDRYAFESSHDNMYNQVKHMGYQVELAYGDFDTPWCQDQSLIWDCDHCFNHNLWDIYERQFAEECDA